MCIIYTLLIVNVYGELIGSHFLQQKECHFKCIYFPMMNDVNFDDILVFSLGGGGWDWQVDRLILSFIMNTVSPSLAHTRDHVIFHPAVCRGQLLIEDSRVPCEGGEGYLVLHDLLSVQCF